MIKNTQRNWVLTRLKEDGYITRNECLRNYISRLSAIIADLKRDGWEFETGYIEVQTQFGKGKDFKYSVNKEGLSHLDI